jgi:hypothetical protein
MIASVSVRLPTVRTVSASVDGGLGVGDTGSVALLVWTRWQVRPELAHERFAERGWSYEESVVRPCSRCGGQLHSLRKPCAMWGEAVRRRDEACRCTAGNRTEDVA